MNGWRAVGYVFSIFGIVFLIVATIVGLPVLSSINFLGQDSSETFLNLFIAAMLPYVIIASLMFVIAALGFYAGRTPRIVHAKGSSYSQSSSYRVSPPHPQVSSCPSCGQPVIFMAQYQRWYCPQEKKYV
jgi:hypothetical protein